MKIILNGKTVDVEEGLSVADLVKRRKFNSNVIIVEYNYEVIKKEAWAQTRLKEGDRLEVLQLVGGG